jgi:hypothetical protein
VRSYSILLCAIIVAGCSTQSGPGAHAGDPYIVKVPRTLFYTYGPAQATGPDFALFKGQRLTMLSYEFGYSHVAIQGTGQTGYVPTEDLAPAPPSAGASPGPSPAVHRHRWTPLPNAAQQPLVPLPEFPESKPPPGSPPFRY